MFDAMYYRSWSFEIEILLEQKQVLSGVDSTEDTPEDVTELKSWKKQHGIGRWTILLTMEWSFQQQYGVQQDAIVLWDQLKEDWKSMVKLTIWALWDTMSAVKLRDSENVQQYTVIFQGYGIDITLSAESLACPMPTSK